MVASIVTHITVRKNGDPRYACLEILLAHVSYADDRVVEYLLDQFKHDIDGKPEHAQKPADEQPHEPERAGPEQPD